MAGSGRVTKALVTTAGMLSTARLISADRVGVRVVAGASAANSSVEGADLGERAILAYAAERLAASHRLRSVEIVDELPRTPTGKIIKRRLVDRQG